MKLEYKGRAKHVMQQVVIFFASVAKSIVGSNLDMPYQISGSTFIFL